MKPFVYQAPEPTRMCTICKGVFEYKFLVPSKTSPGGVRPLCKPCCRVQQVAERERRAKRAAELIKAETQARKALPNMVPPRTFNHIKSKEVWTGHTERQYIRNSGNKHIPSKGIAT